MNKTKEKKIKGSQELAHIKYFDGKIDRAINVIEKHNWKIFKIVIGIIVVVLAITGWQIYSNIQSLVEARLDKEFSTDNIRILIEESAKRHTEDKVDDIITEKVETSINPFSLEIQEIVKKANLQLEGLTSIIILRGSANLGVRSAYESLMEIATSDSVLAQSAQMEVATIRQNMQYYLKPISGSHFTVSVDINGKVIPSKDLTTSELFTYIEQQSVTPEHRFSLLFDLIEQPDEEVFSQALRILKESQYLPAIIATNGVLINLLGHKADPFDFEAWIKILEDQ